MLLQKNVKTGWSISYHEQRSLAESCKKKGLFVSDDDDDDDDEQDDRPL
jgi:hypothetical protein